MIRKLTVLISTIFLLQILIPVIPSQAANEIIVANSSAEVDFPDKLDFSLSAESGADITDIRLYYYVDRLSYAYVTSEVYIEFTPAKVVDVEWSWDMRKTGGLPPGTVLQYWWLITDEDGNELETQPMTLSYDDNRFDWKSIKKGIITLYWYEGDEEFANRLLSAATEGLERLYNSTGVSITDPVDIYIYANSADLQSAMIFPQTWTGGVAYALYDCVAIGIEPSNIEWGLRTIVHELTHLVVHRMTYNPYLDLPTWLDEGLAMYMEGPLSEIFNQFLGQAVENDSLISVRSLASPFSAYADQSYLSYAESYGLVFLLINAYGQEKMLELLTVMSKGTDYDEAFEEVYGFDMDGLDDIWRDYIVKVYTDQTSEISASLSGQLLPELTLSPASGSM